MKKQKTHEYHCLPQERALRILALLAGNEVKGVSPSQLARALGEKPPVITRDMWNLVNVGFAERLDNDTFRLGPKLLQIATSFQRGLIDIRREADELEQRGTRSPR